MYCTKCGEKLVDGARFCHKCGTKAQGGSTLDDLSNLTMDDVQDVARDIASGAEELARNLFGGLKKSAQDIRSAAENAADSAAKYEGPASKATEIDFHGSIEAIIDKSPCSRTAAGMIYGCCVLTAKRIVFIKKSIGDLSTTGSIIDLPAEGEDFSIEPENLMQITDGRQAAGRSFIFELYDGNLYDLYMPDRNKWLVNLMDWAGVDKVKATV